MNLFKKLSIAICAFAVSMGQLSALEQDDVDAIQGIIQGYTDSWNNNAGQGFGKDFTSDADFVNIFAMNYSGADQIEVRHQEILATFLRDSTLSVTSVQLREVYSGLVIGLVRWSLDGFRSQFDDPTLPPSTRNGIFTQVFINNSGQWQITATQNTLSPF